MSIFSYDIATLQKLKKQAEEGSKTVCSRIDAIMGQLQDLSEYWKGENARTFIGASMAKLVELRLGVKREYEELGMAYGLAASKLRKMELEVKAKIDRNIKMKEGF